MNHTNQKITRRRFLQGSLLAMGATMLPAAVATPSPLLARESYLPLFRTIYDRRRVPVSMDFGRAVQERGLAVSAIEGNIAQVWRQELLPQWRKQPAAIAGLTRSDALFCLEQIARDYRMHVVFRGEHRPDDHGRLVHQLFGPLQMLGAADPIAMPQMNFGVAMAHIIDQYPLIRPTFSTRTITGGSVSGMNASETLYSWIIV